MLHDERHFVTVAQASVKSLIEHDYAAPPSGETQSNSVDTILCAICDAAKPVRARGVILAAQECNRAYGQGSDMPSNDFSYAVMTLDRLIEQYTKGLYEIDPEFAQMHAKEPSREQENDLTLDVAATEVTSNGFDTDLTVQAGHASETLKSLMPFAHDHDYSALSHLLELNQQQCSAFGSAAISEPLEGDDQPRISIEALMQPVTNALLSAAHSCDVPVSVSYGLGDIDLPKADAVLVSDALIAGGVHLISALPSNRPECGTVQIEITAVLSGADIRLDMTVPHIDMSQDKETELCLKRAAFAALSAIGAEASLQSTLDNAQNAGALMQLRCRRYGAPVRPALAASLNGFEDIEINNRMSEALA